MSVNCPYCDALVKIDHEDGYGTMDGEQYEQDCSECNKTFIYYPSIHYSYELFKADCLNGGTHEWSHMSRATAGGLVDIRECRVCGKSEVCDEHRMS